MAKPGPKPGWVKELRRDKEFAEGRARYLAAELCDTENDYEEAMTRLLNFNTLPLHKKLWFIITGGVV
jgi:hypothetical protein